jgi:hypothetical protein
LRAVAVVDQPSKIIKRQLIAGNRRKENEKIKSKAKIKNQKCTLKR